MPAITDRMSYLVTVAHPRGDYLSERALSDLDRTTTVKDIADGQFTNVLQVIEFNPAEGICHDVTEDIAREVMTEWAKSGEPLEAWQFDFIALHVGLSAANSFRRAA